jgi:hypothetical protein
LTRPVPARSCAATFMSLRMRVMFGIILVTLGAVVIWNG